PPKLSKADIEQLRIKAKSYLPSRVAEIAQQYSFCYGRVTIRASRSKWGCCTAQNNLSLSLFLMLLPHHLQDYIIVHELCHTVHHNHSAKFHSLVDRCLQGREKEFAKELRLYNIP
ncbi:MAG: M48 family metallopeptidase, partial [Alistipes sp.]|nr:M48 family metallopeptidase [Alistipes sp.]